MEERNVAEAIPINSKGEVLLQKKTTDYRFGGGVWTVFGGEIKEGESPEEAVKRELKEETGCEIDKIRLLDVKDYAILDKKGKRYIFEVIFDKGISDISLNEGAGFAFFNPSELNTINLQPIVLDSLKKYFNKKPTSKIV